MNLAYKRKHSSCWGGVIPLPLFQHALIVPENHVKMSPGEWRARPLSMDWESLSFGVKWEARLFHLMTMSDNGFSRGYISEEKMKVAWKNLTCFTDISLNRLLFRTKSVQYHHRHQWHHHHHDSHSVFTLCQTL